MNYYQVGLTYREVRALDGWIRRRMRLYYWQQWGRPRARRLNNKWLESQGLHSLETQWVNARYPEKALKQPKGK